MASGSGACVLVSRDERASTGSKPQLSTGVSERSSGWLTTMCPPDGAAPSSESMSKLALSSKLNDSVEAAGAASEAAGAGSAALIQSGTSAAGMASENSMFESQSG